MQGSGTETDSFRDDRGLRWRCGEGFRGLLEDVLSKHLPPREDGPLRVLKRSKRRQVYALAAPGRVPLIVKRYPARRRFPDSLRDAFRTRALDEFEIGCRLWERGFATPRPIGVAERWHRGRIRESYYVAEELRGAQALGPWMEWRYAAGDGESSKLDWIQRAAEVLQKVHDEGLYHRDYHGGNLLIREAEGPAGRLFLIDFPVAVDLGTVPRGLRARDLADLVYSLRHVLDEAEEEAVLSRLAVGDLDVDVLSRQLVAKKRRARHDRLQRAFRNSSQFARERDEGRTVYRDRSLSIEELRRYLEEHDRAIAAADSRLLRVGRRSILSMHQGSPAPGVVVKEYRGGSGSARRRARDAWRGGVGLQVADLLTAQPLALVVGGRDASSYVLAKALPDCPPLHLLAHRSVRSDRQRKRASAIADAVLELLVRLVRSEVHHPDLSLKNLLVREHPDERVEVLLVDWDGVRPRRGWTEQRLARALAQIGDLPARNFSHADRRRFVTTLLARLGLGNRRDSLLRQSAARLARRRKLHRCVGSTP